MDLGKSLSEARRKSGLSQEEAAARIGVSRQTLSKWELGETLPNLAQASKLAEIYRVTLDELADFDAEVKKVEEAIQTTSEEMQKKIDWTKMWAKKYPVLASYQKEVQTAPYESTLKELLSRLKTDHGYSNEDALLVLKDILAHLWKEKG